MSVFNNHILLTALLGWLVAQIGKTLYELLVRRQLLLSRLVSSGGMPSAHSVLVMALVTAVGRIDGFTSSSFAVAVIMASIVMYDAAGVRYAVSKQARLINRIMEQTFKGEEPGREKLYELVGHTPVQVLVGALLGILVGLLMTW